MICLGMDFFFYLPHLGFAKLLESRFMPLSRFGEISGIISLNIFQLHSFPLGTLLTGMLVLEALFICCCFLLPPVYFLSFFQKCVCDFYLSVFKFTDSFLHYLFFSINCTQNFKTLLIFFSSVVSTSLFLYVLFLS